MRNAQRPEGLILRSGALSPCRKGHGAHSWRCSLFGRLTSVSLSRSAVNPFCLTTVV